MDDSDVSMITSEIPYNSCLEVLAIDGILINLTIIFTSADCEGVTDKGNKILCETIHTKMPHVTSLIFSMLYLLPNY